MKHSYIEITNYKGIGSARVDFDVHPRGRVYTLVGLNESGKTTILSAIASISYTRESLHALQGGDASSQDPHALIPVNKLANFNGDVVVKAGYTFDAEDNAKIRTFLDRKLGFELTDDLDTMEIVDTKVFRDSVLDKEASGTNWHVVFKGVKRRGRVIRELDGDEWEAAADYVEELLPRVLYFPNFLFEFPDRIYLEDYDSLDAKSKIAHQLYRGVLQDVLDAMPGNTRLDRHVLERAKTAKERDSTALNAVLRQMGDNITRTVFSQWNRIFGQSIGGTQIEATCGRDEQHRFYVQLRLRVGAEEYQISQRSLGFRWFFAFLMLTHYRGFRKAGSGNVLFLLDEPASNLHPTAQQQLLKSFARFPETCSIVYATHSHHLINPDWLENTFVVKNEGLTYEHEDENYSAANTAITIERYRQFAAKHPEQQTYFRPVLDVLDYCPSRLENVPNVAMIEGKNDFYSIKYLVNCAVRKDIPYNLMPGGGSGNLDTAIRLYVAWGRDFLVMLDSDRAGKREKQRYIEMFGNIVSDRLFTLADIDPGWEGISMEDLLTADDKELIQRTAYPPEGKYQFDKLQFNRAVQEMFLTGRLLKLSKESQSRIERLHLFLKDRLQ